jgi:hypothetical protein
LDSMACLGVSFGSEEDPGTLTGFFDADVFA